MHLFVTYGMFGEERWLVRGTGTRRSLRSLFEWDHMGSLDRPIEMNLILRFRGSASMRLNSSVGTVVPA